MNTFLISLASMGAIGALFGFGLAYASKRFAVEVDPTVAAIAEVLPGINCGACGQAGCQAFAEAVAAGRTSSGGCTPGGAQVAEQIGTILGVDPGPVSERMIAQLLCHGGCQEAPRRSEYYGIEDCRGLLLVAGGDKGCSYGCVGKGNCERACPFGAIKMNENDLPVVDEAKCTGCGRCVVTCPQELFILTGESQGVHVRCRNTDKGADVRKVCSVGCIACRLCEKQCDYDAIHVTNNLAEIDYQKCTNCGDCVEKCPMATIVNQGKELKGAALERLQ